MTKEELLDYIDETLASNTTGKITAYTLRTVLKEIVNTVYSNDTDYNLGVGNFDFKL